MKVTLIAAVAENGVIGRDGDLPWRLSADLKQFKARTLGHPILMGRKTWESLPRRPLKDRLNVVLTRQPGYVAEGATVAPDLDAALAAASASGAEEAFVIGGESVYAAALPVADSMVLTHVEATVEGDARFPAYDPADWVEISREEHVADEKNAHAFAVVVYRRASATAETGEPEGDIDAVSEDVFARAVVEAAPVIALMLDRDGRVVHFNAFMEQLSGYSLDEARGLDWFERFIPDREKARIRALFEKAVTGARTHGNVNAMLTKSGEERLVQWYDTAVLEADGEPAGLVAIGIDVTEQTRLAEAQRELQKMEAVGTLASGIAHDFNNLLMGVIGLADHALASLPDEGEPTATLEAIRRSARRGSAIVRQLLSLGQEAKPADGVAEVDTVVASRADLLAALLGDDVELVLSLDAQGASVGLTEGRLEQILLNLAANAHHAMPRGGRFVVETVRVELGPADARGYTNVAAGPCVRLSVSDDGVGMTEEVRQRVFEPFFTTRRSNGGTGLGLATVYGLLRRIGAHIEVESAEGAGCRFRILLPEVSAEERAAAPPDPPSEDDVTANIRVLVVEDEPLVRFTVRHYLEGAGYTVIEAGDTEEALRQAAEQPVDVLLTDVVLPQVGGDALAAHLRGTHPGLRVVFMSAHPREYLIEEGRITEESLVLSKPFGPEELLRMVVAALTP